MIPKKTPKEILEHITQDTGDVLISWAVCQEVNNRVTILDVFPGLYLRLHVPLRTLSWTSSEVTRSRKAFYLIV